MENGIFREISCKVAAIYVRTCSENRWAGRGEMIGAIFLLKGTNKGQLRRLSSSMILFKLCRNRWAFLLNLLPFGKVSPAGIQIYRYLQVCASTFVALRSTVYNKFILYRA